MKVEKLIEELEFLDPEAEVVFIYDYGDHARTLVAGKINKVSEGVIRYSDYHRLDKVVTDDMDPKDEDREAIFLE